MFSWKEEKHNYYSLVTSRASRTELFVALIQYQHKCKERKNFWLSLQDAVHDLRLNDFSRCKLIQSSLAAAVKNGGKGRRENAFTVMFTFNKLPDSPHHLAERVRKDVLIHGCLLSLSQRHSSFVIAVSVVSLLACRL